MSPGERGASGGWFYETCCKCKEPFAITAQTQKYLERSGQGFKCPFGHLQYYAEGPTEADKLRHERDRLKQKVAEKDDEVEYHRQNTATERERAEAAERSARAQKGVATRLKNRAKAGVCPCCNRSFQNLASHMKNKHPDFGDDNVVPLKSA